jgi:S1-C subfamily serine protease
VYSGTPAASAGLAQGDVITAANGKTVSSAQSLITITSALRPGQSLPLSYVDSTGVTRSATVTLIGGPAR